MTSSGSLGLSPRRVVFDVNVYIDVARQCGPSFTWETLPSSSFDDVETDHQRGAQYALRIAREGRYIGPIALELWTSTHITDMVVTKLISELNWDDSDAERYGQEMLDQCYRTRGAELTVGIARQSPPLDHEDGLVFATAVASQAQFLVSNDADFVAVDRINGVEVMTPHQWACFVMGWRKQAEGSR